MIDRSEAARPVAPDAAASSDRKAALGGVQLASSPVAGPGLLKKTEDPAVRLGALIAAGEKAYALFDAAMGYEDSKEWAAALQTLRDTGVERGVHTDGSWDASLTSDAAKVQRYEWFLGQILGVAEAIRDLERPPSFLWRIQKMGQKLAEIPGGTDLVAALVKHDADNEKKRKLFIKERTDAGMIDSLDSQFKTLFPDTWGYGLPKLVGRQVALLYQTNDYELVRLEGKVQPFHGAGNAIWHLEPKGGGPEIEFNTNDVRAFLAEDRSPVTQKQFAERAKQRGDLDYKGVEKLFGSSWWNAFELDGRRGSFLLPDREKGQWEVVEGTVRPDKTGYGGAVFYLEPSGGGPARKMNINDVQSWYVEDTSPERPDQLRAEAKKAKMVQRRTPAYSQSIGSSWNETGALVGREVAVLLADKTAHQWRVVKGKVAEDDSTRGTALFYVEAKDGGRTKLNINDVEDLWASKPAKT